jgi:O-antigen/teichoic acid export membrane protein
MLGALVGSFGLDLAAASLVAQRLSVARWVTRRGTLLAAVIAVVTAAGTVAWLASGQAVPFGVPAAAFALAAAGIPVGILGLVYGGALRGLGQILTWNAGIVIEVLVVVAALAALLATHSATVTAAIAVWLGAQIIRIGYWALRLHVSLPPSGAAPDPHTSMAVFGLQNWGAQLVGTLNIRVNYFVLFQVAGAAEVGQYSTAVPLAEAVVMGPASIATATLPRFAVSDREECRRLAFRSIRFALYSALLTATVLLVALPVAVTIIFGARFRDAIAPALVLLPGYVLWSSVHITTVYFQGSAKRPLINLWVAMLATAVDIPLALWLGSVAGATGAALASTVAYATAAALNMVVFLRVSGGRWSDLLSGASGDWPVVRGTLAHWATRPGIPGGRWLAKQLS